MPNFTNKFIKIKIILILGSFWRFLTPKLVSNNDLAKELLILVCTYLGESMVTDSSSATGRVRKHGARSSSSKSPWQPVRSATFRFTYNGSFWIAHGDSAEPLSNIARFMRSLATGETIKMFANDAPVPCPISVTLLASPLNAGRFSRSQCRPATKSIKPKLPWALPLAPVFRKPMCKRVWGEWNSYFLCCVCLSFCVLEQSKRAFIVSC